MERPILTIFRKSNLLVGLLLLVLVAAVPSFAVLLDLQHELRSERSEQARTIALQRAELLGAVVDSTVAGTAKMLLTLSTAPAIRAADPSCGMLLRDVRQTMPAYGVLALARRDGVAVCSDGADGITPALIQAMVRPFQAATGFMTGGAVPGPDGRPMLTIAMALPSRGDGPPSFLVAGLALAALQDQFAAIQLQTHGRLVVADRDGVILAAAPDGPDAAGTVIRARGIGLLGAALPGTTMGPGGPGPQRVLGYIPPRANASGLFVGVGFEVAELVGGIDRAAHRGYLLILLGTAFSLLLALYVGHRYLRAPASVLLDAARRWGSGDLTSRALMPAGAPSEFTGLGTAFNEMAELLQRQRAELQAMNDALELRVADRTRALLDSNNRLQVEIAERELTAASLRQAQKLQAVGELAGGMAHEFNNLLTAILGSLDLLRRRMPGAEPRTERLLDAATEAVERGSRLTSQLLSFSRKQPLLAVSVDLAAAIAGMAGLLASTLGAKIRLETRIDADLWPARLDPNQFEASLLNLALNARDAMAAGGRLTLSAHNVSITPASPWSELAPGDYVDVTVADSGAGMSEAIASRAFEPFFTTKPPGRGAGLGLAQVYGMVQQSGGSVTIGSRPNDGTKVVMMLPRSTTAPAAEEPEIDYSQPALGPAQPVLVVDDDAAVRDVTEAILVENGYAVLTAADGATALMLLDRERGTVGLVLADYSMPGMSGRELLLRVRQRWPDVAILLATGYADYSELTGLELPIDQIVRKPFRTNQLLARIHLVVRRPSGAAVSEPVG